MGQLDSLKHREKFRHRFIQALKERDDASVRTCLDAISEEEAAEFLSMLHYEDIDYVLSLLNVEIRAKILIDLDEVMRVSFFKMYPIEDTVRLIGTLHSDEAADVLNELPIGLRENVLAKLNDSFRSLVIDLLRYDEDTAGGMMAKELVKAYPEWTVEQCINEIRKQAEVVSKFYIVYVVDNRKKLIGWMPLYEIVLAEPHVLVNDIYDSRFVSIETHMNKNAVAEVMRKYNLETIPVIDAHGYLVGRITIDDVVDVITEQAEEERNIMSGVSKDTEEYFGIWRLAQARLPWLLVGVVGGFISVWFMGLFERDIVEFTMIAFFIPLIQATSGNVGIQSSSIVVQNLVRPDIVYRGLQARLLKVVSVAMLNGFFLALVVMGLGLLTGIEIMLCVAVSLALFVVVLMASFIGTVTPLLLNKFGANPALASGPFITTINDIFGLGIYLSFVHLVVS